MWCFQVLWRLWKIHEIFMRDTYELSKYGTSFVTIFPSLIFLLTSFIIIYRFCHRYTSMGYTPVRTWFFRELTFHWSYFYLSKLWFMFMRMYKLTAGYVCQGLALKDPSMNLRHCHLTGLFILSIVSMVPLAVYVVRKCSRTHIPNFLLWIAEDPWTRTEIGLAGHYLERPPRFLLPTPMNISYRTKRSSSIQERARKGTFVRVSRSVECAASKHTHLI